MSNQQSIALTPLAAAVSAALAPAGAQAQEDQGPALEEIVVTATKREENLQEIPASIQAIPQAVLEKMGALGIEDYSRFIPSVNVVSYSPGATDSISGAGTCSSTPSWAPSSPPACRSPACCWSSRCWWCPR